MTMIVNSRQLASMTSLFLEKNHGNLARGLTRLSSGIRFATAADDAGNLAVSVKLNSSLKRSSVIHKNIQNARSFLSMQEDAYKGLGNIIDRMAELGIDPQAGGVYFGQLLGMADNVTFVLGKHGYKAYKYVPYGPIAEVMPYLIRRSQENSAMLGTPGVAEERRMISAELRRRIFGRRLRAAV